MKYEEIMIRRYSSRVFNITQFMVDTFSLLTGDENSVHKGEKAIVHGMLIASLISNLIGNHLPGDGAIWASHNIKFIQPVFVGDQITISAIVDKKEDRSRQIKLNVDAYNQNNDIVISSSCWVKVPE